MTRRELLSLLLVGGVGCSGRVRASLKNLQAARPDFERMDCHIHVHALCPPIIAGLRATGWRAMVICVCGAVGDEPYDVEGLLQKTAKLHRESEGRIAWTAAFDARGWENPDFTERVTASLGRAFDQGAVGVKIWKNVGMAIRSKKTGEYLKPDNAALAPIYESIQMADRTLVIHVADVDRFFMPTPEWRQLYEEETPSWLQQRPLWWRLYGRPGAPDNWWNFEQHPGSPPQRELLLSRDRILASHPKLRVVGAHLGSNWNDLHALADRLDTYANFAVDVSACVPHLAQLKTEMVRQFFLKYQDRIVYGSDVAVLDDQARDQQSWRNMDTIQEREWSYFASSGIVTVRDFGSFAAGHQVLGLGLSHNVLRKIFQENPTRWFPGIAR